MSVEVLLAPSRKQVSSYINQAFTQDDEFEQTIADMLMAVLILCHASDTSMAVINAIINSADPLAALAGDLLKKHIEEANNG
jgi:hypothetical protein